MSNRYAILHSDGTRRIDDAADWPSEASARAYLEREQQAWAAETDGTDSPVEGATVHPVNTIQRRTHSGCTPSEFGQDWGQLGYCPSCEWDLVRG